MARVSRVERRSIRLIAAEDGGPRDHSPRQRRAGHGKFFLAGAIIPESGIYEVIHESGHRAPHESVLVKGDPFPFCDVCQGRVRFHVVRTAPYIFDDSDFIE